MFGIRLETRLQQKLRDILFSSRFIKMFISSKSSIKHSTLGRMVAGLILIKMQPPSLKYAIYLAQGIYQVLTISQLKSCDAHLTGNIHTHTIFKDIRKPLMEITSLFDAMTSLYHALLGKRSWPHSALDSWLMQWIVLYYVHIVAGRCTVTSAWLIYCGWQERKEALANWQILNMWRKSTLPSYIKFEWWVIIKNPTPLTHNW